LPGSAVNGSSTSNEQKGKMLYAYEANDTGELTVGDGREVTILEGDGKTSAFTFFPKNIDINQMAAGQRFEQATKKVWCQPRISRYSLPALHVLHPSIRTPAPQWVAPARQPRSKAQQ
jgi:hypothetical protein